MRKLEMLISEAKEAGRKQRTVDEDFGDQLEAAVDELLETNGEYLETAETALAGRNAATDLATLAGRIVRDADERFTGGRHYQLDRIRLTVEDMNALRNLLEVVG